MARGSNGRNGGGDGECQPFAPAPREDGIRTGPGRKPADVWWRSGAAGKGIAWDLAKFSGMRKDRLAGPSVAPESMFDVYEHSKCTFQDTGRQCSEHGFVFQPLNIEAHRGGWSLAFRNVVDE